jgi:hypothetical protein
VLRPLALVVSTIFLAILGSTYSFAQGQALLEQTSVDETRLVRLSGTVHPLARPDNDGGAVPDSFPANRMVVLVNPPAERKQALERFLRDAHTPGSASYQKWITPEEFGARFGARDEDVRQVQAWLQSHGFSIARVTKSKRFMEFLGTAAQVREALHAEIHQYGVGGKTYYSVSTEVSIPETLAPIIGGFAPLNTFPLTSFVHTAGRGTLSPSTRRVQPEFTTTSGGKTFYALAPEDFATQYDLGPVYQTGTDGTGQTIGILDELNLDLSVVDAYRKLYGLPGDNTQVVIDGEDPGVGLNPSVEGFLDVEVAGAVAPKAKVNYYIAGGSYFQSPLVLAAMRAIEDNQADILSVSYGECEQILGPTGNLLWSTLWEQAAAQGQTVLVASGDSGPATCPIGIGTLNGPITYFGLSVNGLASTPWNVAVGGTDFYYSDYATGGGSISGLWNSTNDVNFGSLKAPLPEQPWDEDLGLNIIPFNSQIFSIPSGAGGGGASNCSQFVPPTGQSGLPVCAGGYPKPAWQRNATGVPADGVRDLPDVSLFAAPGKNLTAFAICVEPGDCAPVSGGEPRVLLVGGTSASTPAMAGIMALVDQKHGRQGQANFKLYALADQQPSAFHDIMIGTNDTLCEAAAPGCTAPVPNVGISFLKSWGVYAATPGYDLASGLGSVDANALIANWNKVTFTSTSTTLQISPSSFVHGSPVSITASVTPASGTGTPTGDVNIATTSPLPLVNTSEITLAGGSATTSWNFFPGGAYQVTAQYAGDGTFQPSTSAPSTLTITPEASTTAFSLQYRYEDTSTPPITVHSGTLASGGQAPFSSLWTFEAQPSGQSGQTVDATGTATFTDGAISITLPLNAKGIATWSPQVLAIGAHSVTVSYSGDASYNASTAGPLTFTVTQGIPELAAVLEARPVTLAGYQAGSTVLVHVLMRALNSFVPPSGIVTVNFGSLPPQTGTLTVATYSNQGLSSANFTFPNVPAGTYTLSASYAGDSNWKLSSFTSPTTYTFASGTNSPTATMLSLTPSSVDSSSSVKFTATVTASQMPVQPIQGIVSLYASGTIFSSLAVTPTATTSNSVSMGTVTVPGSALPSGDLQVTAEFLGGFGFESSSSTPVPLHVSFTDFTMSAGSSRVLVKSGQSASVPLVLGGPNGGSTTVSLTCLPSATSFGCALNPSTQVVRAATSASLSINAFIPGATYATGLERAGARRGLFATSAVFAFGFLFLMALPLEHRRGLLLCFAFLAIGTFIAGCGGYVSQGYTPPPPNVNTPAGTYNVLVTATSGGVTHNINVTAVIQ